MSAETALAVAAVAGAYLLGSVSWSVLMVRALIRRDVRKLGSGNAGATNVLRTCGPLPAAAVLLLDVGKGAAATWTARLLGVPGIALGAVAVAVVLGHAYPLFHGLRGGKGVATAAGAFVSLAPVPGALALLIAVMVIAVSRYVSLGSLVGVAVFPPAIALAARLGWIEDAPAWLLGSASAIALFVVFRHHANIKRLRRGREWKLRRQEEQA